MITVRPGETAILFAAPRAGKPLSCGGTCRADDLRLRRSRYAYGGARWRRRACLPPRPAFTRSRMTPQTCRALVTAVGARQRLAAQAPGADRQGPSAGRNRQAVRKPCPASAFRRRDHSRQSRPGRGFPRNRGKRRQRRRQPPYPAQQPRFLSAATLARRCDRRDRDDRGNPGGKRKLHPTRWRRRRRECRCGIDRDGGGNACRRSSAAGN